MHGGKVDKRIKRNSASPTKKSDERKINMLKIDARAPKESAKDYVVRQLIYNIIHVNLIPGQRIDADELSRQLNVSKNPVREAELELSQTRLIEIKPKIGAFVSYIDTKIVDEVRELRSVLESELAR